MEYAMNVSLPKAFSVRDEHELVAFKDLMTRLNSELKIREVAQGLHVNGGSTVYWAIVYAEEPTKDAIYNALIEAGLNPERWSAIE